MNNRSRIFTATFILIAVLVVPALGFAQNSAAPAPENLDQVKQIGKNALEVAKNDLPGLIANIWKNEVLPIWKNMLNWAKTNLWDNWLKSWFQKIWESILRILRVEVEKRKPGAQEEIQKQKEEIKQEAPKLGKSLWDKFLDIIR